MAPFAALFCVVVCSSFTVSLACEGSDVQQIVSELGSVDWKVLAGWLDVGTDGIEENCLKQGGDLATCYRMRLVKRYCDKTAHSPRQVADDMADVLENRMSIKKKQAGKLRQLTFRSPSADRHPSSPSDSTTHHSPSHSQKPPQPTTGPSTDTGYWVPIGVALAVVAVPTCIIIYLIYTRAGPLSGVPPAGVTSPGVPPPGVSPPGVSPSGVTSPGVTSPGVPPSGVTSPGVPPAGVTSPGVTPPGVTSPGVPPAGVPPAARTIHLEPHHSPIPDEPAHDATVEPPELPDLVTELDEVAHRWKDIGIMLRLNGSSIDRISADNYRVRDCMRAMLSEWLNREISPTWQTIVEALRSGPVKELRLARDIEQKYKSY